MFKSNFVISITVFVTLLLITSVEKNKTRVLEKKISELNSIIFNQKKDINETQLDFHYLTSPSEIEKRLELIGFDSYQPIKFSNIFFDFSDFINIQSKISTLKNINEKKIKK